MTQLPLRLYSTTHSDLLAVPAVLLGFHPHESLVLLGMVNDRVHVCARFDLDWHIDDAAALGEQMTRLSRQVDPDGLVLLAFGEDPQEMLHSITQFLGVLDATVGTIFMTDHRRYWGPLSHPVDLDQWQPWSFEHSSLAAEATFNGVQVDPSRERALRCVEPPPLKRLEAIARALSNHRRELAGTALSERTSEAEGLLSRASPLGRAGASRLACLLDSDDVLNNLLAAMSRADARAWRPRLLEARQHSDRQCAPNVLALVGLTSWMSGSGAVVNACLEQLNKVQPEHPVGLLLDRVQELGIPPTAWDKW